MKSEKDRVSGLTVQASCNILAWSYSGQPQADV